MAAIVREFLGISTGAQVQVGVTQGGKTASGSTNSNGWGVAPDTLEVGPLAISVYRSPLKVAPEPINFEVTGWTGFDTTGPAEGETFDPRLHNLVYIWDFGDEGSVYTAPVNVPAEFLNRNVGYGYRVSHTYRTAGSPTISVLVVEPSSGKWATASITLNGTGDLAPVQAEDDYFTGAATIWVDTAGNTTGMPAGATAVTSVVAAEAAVAARSAPTRVILRSGQTFTRPNSDTTLQTWPVTYWRASDLSGTRPIIDWSSGSGSMWDLRRGDALDGVKVVRLNRLEVLGPNDLINGSVVATEMMRMLQSGPRYVQMDDCVVGAVGLVVNVQNRGDYAGRLSLNDCHFKDNDFAVFGYFDDFAVTGCRFTHHPDNLCGGFKLDQNNEHGGSMRTGRGDHGVIDGCDMMVRAGWLTKFIDENVAMQNAPLRWSTEGRPSRLNMRRCTFEAGYGCIGLSHQEPGVGVTRAVNYTVGECVVVGSWSTDALILMDCAGVTIENCLGIIPAVEGTAVSRNPLGFVNIFATNPASTGRSEPIQVRNNSFVVEAGNARFRSAFSTPPIVAGNTAEFPALVQANNVYHAPNLNTPVLSSPALAKATPFGAATNPGFRGTWVGHNLSIGSIAPGATVTVSYRSGYSGSDFGTFPWKIAAAGYSADLFEGPTTFTITRRTSDYDITNNTASALTPTIIYYDRRNGGVPDVMRTAYKTDPDAMALWHPVSAPGSAPSGVTLIDLLGNLRPGTLHPAAPAGTPTQGALEPA